MYPGGSSTAVGAGGSCRSASVCSAALCRAADMGAFVGASSVLTFGAGFGSGPAGRAGAASGVRALGAGVGGRSSLAFGGAAGQGFRVSGVIKSLDFCGFGSGLAIGFGAGLGCGAHFDFVVRSVSLPA